MKPHILLVLLTMAAMLAPITLSAVDGVVLINQSTVMAAGGFPYVITQPGSYKLTGNLIVQDKNQTAILVHQSHVTIDLNGFAILGPANCAGGFPCQNQGNGFGITTGTIFDPPQFNITVRNGTIQGMGENGIDLVGDSHLVEYVHARSNGGVGVIVSQSADGGASIVQHVNAERNGSYGIFLDRGLITGNEVSVNFNGIGIVVGTVSDNLINRNLTGLLVFGNASYKGNVLDGNGATFGGNVTGVNMGQNLCNGTACPGAIF